MKARKLRAATVGGSSWAALTLHTVTALIALGFLVAAYAWTPFDIAAIPEVAFLTILGVAFHVINVRLDRGVLSLSGVGLGAMAIALNPIESAIAAFLTGAVVAVVRHWNSRWLQFVGPIIWTSLGSSMHFLLLRERLPVAVADVFGIALMLVTNWFVTAMFISTATGESLRDLYAKTFTAAWYGAFGYIALAALLIGTLIDGSARGFVLATIGSLMCFALTDTLSNRRQRASLEAQLSDADRHLAYSRLVEGVVHNLRNHVWAIQGYLHEIERTGLSTTQSADLDTAESAATDAATTLRNLSTGAAPRIDWSAQPFDVNDMVRHSVALCRPQAREKGIQFHLDLQRAAVNVRGDPVLLREVIMNLLINAVDAVPRGGRVNVSTQIAAATQEVRVTVADNGPGVPEELRHRLFEPHFTTKPNGTGVGLFTSYGIVREHQGKLLYESGRRGGAVFTVVLPAVSG